MKSEENCYSFTGSRSKGMSELMNKHKVKHDYKEFDEGHFGLEYLYEESIPSLINALS